jgi:hypothetical protein
LVGVLCLCGGLAGECARTAVDGCVGVAEGCFFALTGGRSGDLKANDIAETSSLLAQRAMIAALCVRLVWSRDPWGAGLQ